jgi:hypothetical protein
MQKYFGLFILLFLNIGCFAQVTLNLKMFIEGYYAGAGLMDNFGAGGCLFVNNISFNPNDVDTLTISLVDPNNYSVIDIEKGILQIDGTASINFPSAVVGNSYFIRCQHRSAIQTWSATGILMQSVTNYDFSTDSSKAYGSNMINLTWGSTPVWAFYSGDIADATFLALGVCYQDGIIEAEDYTDVENAVSQILTGYHCQDITGDGVVEGTDWIIIEQHCAAIVFGIYPYLISINEIPISNNLGHFIKCICINGNLMIDLNADLQLDTKCELYNLNGQIISATTISEFKINQLNKFSLRDGIYVLKLE